MSDVLNHMYETIDEVHRDKPAATRRQMVAGATAALGSMGMLAWADRAEGAVRTADVQAQRRAQHAGEHRQRRGDRRGAGHNPQHAGPGEGPAQPVGAQEIQAASFEELLHYRTLVSDAVGATPAKKRIWIPNAYLASHDGFFTALAVGDQVFVNAYLLARSSRAPAD